MRRSATRQPSNMRFMSDLLGGDQVENDRTSRPWEPHREISPGWEGRLPIFCEPQAQRFRACLAARAGIELAQDGGYVVVDRFLRDEEPLGDIGVAQPVAEERQHLELPGREAHDVLLRGFARPAR